MLETNLILFLLEIMIKGCEEGKNPCSSNAQCNHTMGSVECTCKETFYGDGMRCTGT
jgi:hypothetical protein